MPAIIPSIACNLDADILSASLPLFSEHRVGGIEWSFDALYGIEQVPEWFTELLTAYSNERRLVGHGVYFSIFSGRWSEDQQNWLNELKLLSQKFKFDHISEHFGFMTGKSFHHGAPLSIPYTGSTLRLGRDRLSRIYDACRCPVGLENLAFSYSLDEVKRHGEFLEKLVEPLNGFIILDLHNLYCQVHNFSADFEDLIKLYPLDRVREIHISGGSWEQSVLTGKQVRRDTHDESVPDEVFDLLRKTLSRCPNLKYVVLEQLGDALKTSGSRKAFYSDFIEMESIIAAGSKSRPDTQTNLFSPDYNLVSDQVAEDHDLYLQQRELSGILETSGSYEQAVDRLKLSSLHNSEWDTQNWQPYMLETAMNIAQKWKSTDD
ncbi:MAG: DUF692 family multinuclear iron-containing protein [Daejeonella sp.]|uniref:multinuclear nonheme iron-dependent oxidase n=1 Tax=Daejeonella sp. JGW-45 TaxID=3034148 RepID=UPI0023EBDA89|nr:DUF692 family multinuclear iron-containing protein [Daejeonella sp. JGW-45]